MPYISVVVPVYNAEKSIERCVNSITGQTFQDIEVILVDDGSQDGSGALCDQLAINDNRVRTMHIANDGVSAARNTGMKEAAGEYLLFVDSDDYLPLHYIEELVQAQKESGKAAFIWTVLQIVSDNHSVKEETIKYAEEARSTVARKEVLKLSDRYLLNSPVNKLYHMDIIKEHGLHMDEKISIAEDLLFNLQYLDAAGECQVVVLNEVPYYYVRNGVPSLDHGYRKNYYATHKSVLDIFWNYCKKWQVPTDDYPLFYRRYWEYIQNAFSNLERKDCDLSRWQKFVEKSKIAADGHFQKSLKLKRNTMGRGSFLVWRSRLYLLVWLYEKIRRKA